MIRISASAVRWAVLGLAVTLGTAAVALYVLADSPSVVSVLGLLAVVIGFTVLPAVTRAARASTGRPAGVTAAQVATAPVGAGTVVSVERTGFSVNDCPELDLLLDVTAADGAEFRARAKVLAEPVEATQLRPGAVLPVRYLPHPEGCEEMLAVLDFDAVPPEQLALLELRARWARGEVSAAEYTAAERGVETVGVLVAVRPAGGRWELTVRLRGPRGELEDRVVVKPLDDDERTGYLVGSAWRVRYLPDDPLGLVFFGPA